VIECKLGKVPGATIEPPHGAPWPDNLVQEVDAIVPEGVDLGDPFQIECDGVMRKFRAEAEPGQKMRVKVYHTHRIVTSTLTCAPPGFKILRQGPVVWSVHG
jgi:hypothetical protein